MDAGVIERFAANDRFAERLGIRLLDVGAGRARAELDLNPDLLNSVGSAHGGVIFTLADFVFESAVNSLGRVAVALDVNACFVKAVNSGRLTAEAREISHSRRIATFDMRVFDDAGDLIAHMTGMAYRKEIAVEDMELPARSSRVNGP